MKQKGLQPLVEDNEKEGQIDLPHYIIVTVLGSRDTQEKGGHIDI